ncbi:antiviral reverse transcriptase Drt3a [Parasphingopyxis marina]|uniref:RNA-directed DNA polymerase n=1 Tax=Parasphingopyxis marina TaxID=2761622 RepID=A0A842HV12_9SPHN|nr:antiviral reverse transcriptase Drt3a [Parasphingopyxis marina]MBC2776765.1 RNA-directed DNA polymerase [Parasphingopyxis marina]
MLDQTFSAQNFRRIYDVENRRGRNVDRAFFPDLVDASARITAASAAIRVARRTNSTASPDALNLIVQPLRERLRLARENREDLVEARMEEVAQAILSDYQIQLESRIGPKGTALFTLPSDPRAYFIGKQIQRNISRLYKLQAGNRRAIISQVYDALNNSFSHFCIRADVTAFYDNINRQTLISEIDSDQLLSHGSKRYIKQALSSYGSLANSATGIPRGLGVSAFLSELYMRSIDEKIRQLPRVIFYARYVDDMIIIFARTAGDDTASYVDEISDILTEKHLTLNATKTRAGSTGPGLAFQFDYLGYHFSVSGGRCEVTIGSQKLARYRSRIDRAFAAYYRQAVYDQKGAARLLSARIKFMTSNTRLINNKRHAYTGIYFNNSHLTSWAQLNGLDAYLAHKVSLLQSAALQDRIDEFSFVRGFIERRFARYNTRTLATIVEAWRYEA